VHHTFHRLLCLYATRLSPLPRGLIFVPTSRFPGSNFPFHKKFKGNSLLSLLSRFVLGYSFFCFLQPFRVLYFCPTHLCFLPVTNSPCHFPLIFSPPSFSTLFSFSLFHGTLLLFKVLEYALFLDSSPFKAFCPFLCFPPPFLYFVRWLLTFGPPQHF